MMKSSGDDIGSRADRTDGAGPALEVTHLDVSRGRTPVLHDLTLSVPRGAVLGLLGPSGCGKTTLMRTIVGVQRIDSDEVRVLGRPAGGTRLRGHIGYVTQQAAVYSDLSVRDNIAYFASLQGAPPGATPEAIAAVGLDGLNGRTVSSLSGGQAGRVSLAYAMVGDPEMLVLDEPTVGLDPVTREELWERFRALATAGHTLVVSSHVMDEATRCDLLALMRDGRLLGLWTPEELLARTGTDTPDQAFLALVRDGVADPGGTTGPATTADPATTGDRGDAPGRGRHADSRDTADPVGPSLPEEDDER
ncbi:MAG: ABC transporter ATP-binding protein [Propionibacterium sp.]|nr:ABC transporter ATP-binding protein [Propionibacterium sp.]